MPDRHLNIDWDSITLDRVPYRIQQQVDAAFLASCTLETFEDVVLGGLIVRLEKDVLMEKLAEKVTEVEVEDEKRVSFERPATWWDHFKLSYQGRVSAWRPLFRVPWLRRQLLRPKVRWTTEYKWVGFHQTVRVAVQQFATFPASPIQTPPKYRGGTTARYERLVIQP